MKSPIRLLACAVLALGVLVTAAGTAAAYPQFQLSRDQTCTGCHIAPAGGGLLNENGLALAESQSQYGTEPNFFYLKSLPSWLALGGDLRAAGGFIRTPDNNPAIFPMQGEVNGHAQLGHFSVYATVGARPDEYDNANATHVWSREHYITYQSNPGGTDGLYIRAGRFMPVLGLRNVEHVDFNRKYGGVPLYAETYGVAVEYVHQRFELHASAFIKDPLIDPVVHDNGGALYGEYRIDPKTQIGVEGMATWSDDDRKYRGGLTFKRYFASEDLLFQAEGQVVNQVILPRGGPIQLVGYAMLSKFLGKAFLLDLGAGHFDEDVRIAGLDRDAVDVNLHWFTTSHLELIWTNRAEVITGPTGAWSLLQVHYRL